MNICLHGVLYGKRCYWCNPLSLSEIESRSKQASILDSRIENMQARIEALEDSKGYAGAIEKQLAHVDNVLSKRIEALERYNKNISDIVHRLERDETLINKILEANERIEALEKDNEELQKYCQSVMVDCAQEIADLQKERDLGVERIKKIEKNNQILFASYYSIEKKISPDLPINQLQPVNQEKKEGLDMYFNFFMQIAHIITCDGMSDSQRLTCVKLRYRQIAFPEKPLSEIENQLLHSIK